MPGVRIQKAPFDVGVEIDRLRRANANIGAVASFVGVVRDVNDDRNVSSMTLEHYPQMTEKAIEEIVSQAHGRWSLIDVTVVHRVGRLAPTDPIVLVVVASAHRQDAFHACQYIMDFLKTRAPLWKKESTPAGERWVASRSTDTEAANAWTSDRTQNRSGGSNAA